jgi:hypothetical protein
VQTPTLHRAKEVLADPQKIAISVFLLASVLVSLHCSVSIHFIKSFHLFGTVAASMELLLQKEWILPTHESPEVLPVMKD